MTVVHKGGEEEYVVMQVQPHPSIVITRLEHSRAHLNGFSSALEESSGTSGRSWTVIGVSLLRLERLCIKEESRNTW